MDWVAAKGPPVDVSLATDEVHRGIYAAPLFVSARCCGPRPPRRLPHAKHATRERSSLVLLDLYLAPLEGDKHANQGFGHLQPGFRQKPEVVDCWGLNWLDRPPNPIKQVEGFALHLFGGV